MIKCSECGYENMDGLDYCDGCGAKLNAASTAEPAAGTTVHASAGPVAGSAAEAAATAPSAAEFQSSEPPPAAPPPAE
ncbi:MAG TPA: hypothetical protein VJ718_06980, partial [Candidatus Binataceae bacterium]|nr:hypothetical protein [Candidatus Binataceae bacterium]